MALGSPRFPHPPITGEHGVTLTNGRRFAIPHGLSCPPRDTGGELYMYFGLRGGSGGLEGFLNAGSTTCFFSEKS